MDQDNENAGAVQPLVIPSEVLDLVRFLSQTWVAIDGFVYNHCDSNALIKYPVIQGTRNQMNLRKISEQPYDAGKLRTAVEWMLKG